MNARFVKDDIVDLKDAVRMPLASSAAGSSFHSVGHSLSRCRTISLVSEAAGTTFGPRCGRTYTVRATCYSRGQWYRHRMPMPEQVKWKLYRAKQHYDELRKELVEYFENDPGELVEAPESTPRNQIFGYKLNGDVPARFGLIAGDFLQNMRSSLDYLVWQLVNANKRRPGTFNAFPICLTLEGWEKSLLKHDRLRGVHSEALAEIKALQPCFSDSPKALPLTVLETLTNHNKHRASLATGVLALRAPVVKLPLAHAEFQVSRMVDGRMVDGERFIAYVALKEEIVEKMEILITLDAISDFVGLELLPRFERFF
jgi:hypothetical protein